MISRFRSSAAAHPCCLAAPAPCRLRASEINITRRRRETGFTLVELIVVLAIIGLSLAIAVPLIARHSGGAALNAAASEIRAALGQAHSTAIVEDRTVVFQGDPGGGYWLDRNHFTLPLMAGAPPLRVATVGGPRISFFPSGGSSGGRIVVSSGGDQREIAVNTLTGRADDVR